MRRWIPAFLIVAALALTGVATNYFYAIEVATTTTTADLVVTDGFEVPVNFKDGATTVASVTGAGEIVATTGVGAYDDVGAPTDIAAIALTGPLATPETGAAPRLSLTNGTDALEMALETGGVSYDMPSGSNTTLTVENSGAGTATLSVEGRRRAVQDNNTISSGTIAYESEYQRTDTEGAASTDDLVTVTGGTHGDFMFLRSTSASRDIVLKHGTSTNNLTLRDNVDFTLDTTLDIVSFVYNGTSWIEVSRTDNGGSGTPAASGTYTPTITAGTNISSPSLTGSGDWSYSRVGTVVTVSGSLTASVTLAGGGNFKVSLPIASNFGSSSNSQCAGTVAIIDSAAAVKCGYVSPESVSDVATCGLETMASGSATFFVHFTYRII